MKHNYKLDYYMQILYYVALVSILSYTENDMNEIDDCLLFFPGQNR